MAAPTNFRKDVSSEMLHFYVAGGARVAAPTNFRKDVSSKMLHSYVAGATESPLIPILERMSQAICYNCILRVVPTRHSNKIF